MRTRKALAAALVAAASGLATILPGTVLPGAAPPALAAVTAPATTGDTYVLPPSKYVLPPELISRYSGSYHMTHAAPGSRLSSADMFITVNAYDSMYGGGQFYGYDNTGAQDSWTNLLYDFHLVTPSGATVTPVPWTTPAQVARDRLVITLFGWGSPSLGTLTLTRAPSGDLAGTIVLYGQARAYPVTFHRIGSVTG
jgi:hypothetical protein